jgi:diguanylate cyclase (GGDEF)-like protein
VRRERLVIAAATLAIVAVPVALIAWLVAANLGARERDRADARLAAALATAQAGFISTVGAADTQAGRIARTTAAQRAIVRDDAVTARRLTRVTPGLVLYSRGRILSGTVPSDSVVRSVAVLGRGGRPIGRVAVAIQLGDALLDRLRDRVQVSLLLVRSGRVTVGPAGVGERLPAASGTVELGGKRYRVASASLPAADARLAAVMPAADVDKAASARTRDVVLAAIVTVLALLVVVEAILPFVRGRVRGRDDDEEALALLGNALAAAHDRAALLPVILESAVEATGAVGGTVLDGGVEVVRTGDASVGEPLRLVIDEDHGAAAEVLLYPPFAGFTPAQRRRAQRLAEQTAVALENVRKNEIARREAATDPLTGLANRRRFMEQLTIEASRRSRSGRPVAVIVADLDDFKQINDRHGHETGDDVLRAFAGLLRGTVRDIDVAARLGGEEFAVLLPETEGAGAAAVAARLREHLEALNLATGEGGPLRVTASFGVASSPPFERVDELPAAADAALYRAKHAGKNRVMETVP